MSYYDTRRLEYYRSYYRRNKHRKKYTYIKKGVMKKLSKTQYAILDKMKRGFVLHQYSDIYQYFENGLYHQVNTRSVQCLIASKHLVAIEYKVRLSEKGINHTQKEKYQL